MTTIKTAELPNRVALELFKMLNPNVEIVRYDYNNELDIATDTHPDELNYPEGWYNASGYLTNKGNTSYGRYSQFPFVTMEGYLWGPKLR